MEEHTLESERRELLDKLLSLSESGEIKYTPYYLNKASNETLLRIYSEYRRQQLEKVNKELSEILIVKFSDLMKEVADVDDAEGLKNELLSNGLFIDWLKGTISYIIPLIPYIGIIVGGVILAKHIFKSRTTTTTRTNAPQQWEEEIREEEQRR